MTNKFRMTALLLSFTGLLAACTVFAQPGAGGGQGGGFGGQGGVGGAFGQGGLGGILQQVGGVFGGGLMGLLQRPEVQKEVQLTDEQLASIQELTTEQQANMRGRMQEMFSGFGQGGGGGQQFAERLRTANAEENADLEKKLGQILRPFQLARLKEIDVQQQVQQGGVNALTSGPVGEALALEDTQRQELQQRSQQINEELEAQIRKLRADAQQKLINALPRNKRTRLQDMMGRPFELPPPTGVQGLFQQGMGGQFQFQMPQGFGGQGGGGGR